MQRGGFAFYTAICDLCEIKKNVFDIHALHEKEIMNIFVERIAEIFIYFWKDVNTRISV